MSHPTRDALLQAGLQLAEQHGLGSMSINAIVAAADVAKGTFYVHFADRTAYLVALHKQFHDGLKESVLSATNGITPGLDRLKRGTTAYLDGCLQAKAIKALLLDARSEPAIADEVRRRNADFAVLAEQDFEAIGWPYPAISARLYVVMTAEGALVELESGQPNAGLRETLFQVASLRL